MRKRKTIKGEIAEHGQEYEDIIDLTDIIEEYPQTSPAWEESLNGEEQGEDFILNEDDLKDSWNSEFQLNGDLEDNVPEECEQHKSHESEKLDVKIVEGIIKEVSREITENLASKIAPHIIEALVNAMDEKMENIAERLFPPMAEKMIQEEIKKLKAGEE